MFSSEKADTTGVYPVGQSPAIQLIYRYNDHLASLAPTLENLLTKNGVRVDNALVFPIDTPGDTIRAIIAELLTITPQKALLPDNTTLQATRGIDFHTPLDSLDTLLAETLFRILLEKPGINGLYQTIDCEKTTLQALELLLSQLLIKNPGLASCIIISRRIAEHGAFQRKLMKTLLAAQDLTDSEKNTFPPDITNPKIKAIIQPIEQEIAEMIGTITKKLGLQTTITDILPANDPEGLVIHDVHEHATDTTSFMLPLPVSQAFVHAVRKGMIDTSTLAGFETQLLQHVHARIEKWLGVPKAPLLSQEC